MYIIECDSTLYVGMTRKQNGGPIPRIHCSFAKSRLWTGIKPKRTFRSHFRLILEIKQLLTSEKKVVEVANRRKVKKIKGQIFGLLLLLLILLYIFFNEVTEVSAGAMVLILTRAILLF